MTITFTEMQTYTVVSCGADGCGAVFAMQDQLYRAFKENRRTWYCPFGHPRVFTGQTKAEKAEQKRRLAEDNAAFWRSQTNQARAEADHQRRRAAAYKGQITKARKRFTRGVCPVEGCRRHFDNLGDHMASKHADLVEATS